MQISSDRYFLMVNGAAAVSTQTSTDGGSNYEARIEIAPIIVLSGTANQVMDALSSLSNHFSAAREAILNHLTES